MLLTGDAYDVINVDDRGDINWGILPMEVFPIAVSQC